jgi:DNA polymerase-2
MRVEKSEHIGWLLDLYAYPEEGVVMWMVGEDGARYRLWKPFPIMFYVGGEAHQLREVWRYLMNQPTAVELARTKRRDLFQGGITVMAITVLNAFQQTGLFYDLLKRFPGLDYYDADIPLALRCGAAWGIFPLARCRVLAGGGGEVNAMTVLDNPWTLSLKKVPLRVLTIQPDVDPHRRTPGMLTVHCENNEHRLGLADGRRVLINLRALLKRYDPDLVLTNWGDTWLFPFLLDLSEQHDILFNPNRDPGMQVKRRKAHSFFTYGQVVYRGQQVQLFGRWHIDTTNAMMYAEYALEGVFEQARVTGLPVQTVARNSPGSGITALQMLHALRQGILIPYQKQQAESFKSARVLMRSDRGGLVYQPSIGLHENVAEIDFVSMYPSIMVRFNISPETVGKLGHETEFVPELGFPVDHTREGFVPQTLEPLLAKRIALKERLAQLSRHDCRYKPYKARSAALKWLLVVCFGYLGYKNARFGRIESHEAVTAYGRECLLRAKEAAEDQGMRVLHMYVDGLWVCRKGLREAEDFQDLLDEILARTGLPIALEGVYRWVAFLPSRADERVPVANRYFGVFQDGSVKARGIALRRGDIPPYIAAVQEEMLKSLALLPSADVLPAALPELVAVLRHRLATLRDGQVPFKELVVSQRISRELEAYRVPSPAARAAMQLKAAGKQVRPGQRVRFLYVHGAPGVYAWDLQNALDPTQVDTRRYSTLLLRAAAEVVQPLGVSQDVLERWVLANAGYHGSPGVLGQGLPLWNKGVD